VGALGGPFDRRGGGAGGPGGWWLATEVDIVLDGRGYRPDVAGWRRERMPSPGKERPVAIRPDWLCEIVSESNRAVDTVTKLRRYHQAGVPHYWILDQVDRTLTVHRHTPDGYLVALRAVAEERVRAEPFDAIELQVAVLLGDDPDE
jgi:Uma2 family endonuclease